MDRLQGFIRMIEKSIERHWDFVIIIDGKEGSGKSTMGLHLKALYDKKYNLNNVLFDAGKLIETMEKAKKGSCILLDEAIISLYKREALQAFNVTLVKAFSIVRAKELFFILVLPNYFDIDQNLRFRANYRFYTYSLSGYRGYCKIYQPKRTEWATQDPYQQIKWEYRFKVLPENFQEKYDEFKNENLSKILIKFGDDIDLAIKKDIEKEEWGRGGTKLAKIHEYMSKHPNAEPKEVAKAVKCTINYARDQMRTFK